MFNVLVFTTFACLAIICVGLQILEYRTWKPNSIGNNPQFLKFQRGFFTVYLMAIFADWLQGPYLYKLYSYYGFKEDQIAFLYVAGFASTVLLGTWAPLAADQFGRKKLCVTFSILYSISCLLKLSQSFTILLIGRVLGGVATSVLFSSFDAWYVHEHLETNDFPKEWISVTFKKVSFWNGILAAIAGILANTSTALAFSPVAPFILAVPFLIASGALVATHWSENYSGQRISFRKSCFDGLREIFNSEKIFFLGLIEALFESVIYIIIFLWTPVLDMDSIRPPLGVVFSSFMLSILIGSAIFHILSRENIHRATFFLFVSVSMATLAMFLLIFFVRPMKNWSIHATFLSLILFQLAVGVYFPSMGFLRGHILPDAHRLAIMNWFRVPINIISCAVLMLLHEDVFSHGNRWIVAICFALLSLAVGCTWRFRSITKDHESSQSQDIAMETEHYHNIF